MTGIDYATDVLKHYVRKYGWLPACLEQRSAVSPSRRDPLRYFTFSAAEAIDVFMLERAGILKRSDESGRLESVFFCERDEEAFGKIARLIGSPAQGFHGEFEDIVLFEEDQDTQGRELYSDTDEFFPPSIRRKLRHKDAHQRLKNSFPFDIINLDLFGIMFPPRGPAVAPLLRAILRVLEWQVEALSLRPANRRNKQFALFLTSHVDRESTNEAAVEQLVNRVSDNISTYEEFRSAFAERFGHLEAAKLVESNFPEFFCLALAKYIANKALHNLGWEVRFKWMYLYSREYRREPGKQYQMLNMVSVYSRLPSSGERLDEPSIGLYPSVVTQALTQGVSWIDYVAEESGIVVALEEDLEHIVAFRDNNR